MDFLFITKHRSDYGGYNANSGQSGGLGISARFAASLLNELGYAALVVEAIDGNDVDRLIYQNQPRVCMIEAIWVTPAKLREVRDLHPNVLFVVRIHSEAPFLAVEGVAFAWIYEYLGDGFLVAPNSPYAIEAIDWSDGRQTPLLPNWYSIQAMNKTEHEGLHIGCFGAVRVLKNQVLQACAAAKYARLIGRRMSFHMNARVEQGDNILKSIRAIMEFSGNQLVMHEWLPYDQFLSVISQMDICMQVSFSESFNITAADAVSMGIPLVGSTAIPWLDGAVDPSSESAIVNRMMHPASLSANRRALAHYLAQSRDAWEEFAEYAVS